MKPLKDEIKEKISIIRVNEDYHNTIITMEDSILDTILNSIQYPIWDASRRVKIGVSNFIKDSSR